MDKLTTQDLEVLLDAVEKWEHDDLAGEMMGDIFQSMIPNDSPTMERVKAAREEQRRKRDEAQRVRKERGVLLRAKLIMMRDSIDADALLAEGQ